MRAYKFRAFDKKENKWLLGYDCGTLGGFSMIGEVMLFGEYTRMLSSYGLADLDNIVIMQFTGLQDKSKVDIYEGDIVKFMGANWMDNALTERIGVVEWNEELLKFDVVSDIGPIPDLRKSYDDNNFEVIGNIFQHPELVK